MTRLAVLTLGCLLLAAAEARPLQPRRRGKRSIVWENLAEEPALRDADAVPIQRLQDNRYYEDWFLDRVLPRVQRDSSRRLAQGPDCLGTEWLLVDHTESRPKQLPRPRQVEEEDGVGSGNAQEL
ncbi:hypothetical protein HPB50_026429 [Hyalomma asiaticum]|uniref:Uncharacterized protein n=1 Tax=Hyalomma asiaticum TaxID=266040 RepID=A0ACB7SAL3_HYAAI|nr:hypothetical protein HPB50_026429 [Hyalomma asiaticum]